MNKTKWQKIGRAVVIGLLLVPAVVGWYLPVEKPEERAVRERIAIDAREDVYLYNGADLYVYSDDHSTQKFHVDGATGNTTVVGTLATTGAQTFTGLLNANGGIAVDTSAFTVADASGNTVVSGTLAVTSTSTLVGALAANGGLTVDTSAFSVADATGNTVVSGTLTVSGTLSATGETAIGDAAGDTATITGDVTLAGARDGTTGYDYFMTIEGDMDGLANGAKTYGLYVSMERGATDDTTGGDLDDAGIKVRVENNADGNTYGYVLRGLDVQAKNDNSGGSENNNVTTLNGAAITAQTDSGTGEPYTTDAYGLTVNVTANGRVTNTLISGDFRLFRQAATEPTSEYVVQIRNSNTSGTGVDAGLYFKSDYSGETDDFDYIIDMSAADADDADIRFSNGETLDNITDDVLTFSDFLAAAEQSAITVSADDTITPTGTYQPLTAAGAVTCNTSTCVADGSKNGQLLMFVNEGSNTITIDGTGANVECKNDVGLAGGDTLILIWDGSDWRCLANYDNS